MNAFALTPLEIKPDYIEGARHIESVLEYFDVNERLARLHNDRPAYLHWEECWKITAAAFFGRFETSRPVHDAPVLPFVIEPREKTQLQKDTYAAPMRRIVKATERKGITTFVLSCGHTLNEIGGDRKQVRKRCKACSRKRGAR